MATVLVVEDEPAVRRLAVFLLRDAGYQVVDFATADEAIAYASAPENKIDTIFTDIRTPGDASGLDLANIFLDARPKASVVVTSGKHEYETTDATRKIAFIPKPWSVGDLLGAVGSTIRR